MNILGISCFYHDSAACLVRSGEVVAAAQEERFTRKKHDPSFPASAIRYCLKEGGIGEGDIDAVAFYEKPVVKFERILETHVAFAPRGVAPFLASMPVWLRSKLWVPDHIKRALPYFRGKIIYPKHHESHAASAFFPSPFTDAAIVVLDAVGEWNTTTVGKGEGNKVELLGEINFPHSLGMLYSAFTYFTGFKVNSGEYKLMGLAPYGEPKHARKIYDHLIDLKEDGSFRLNMEYFNYGAGLTMTSGKFHRLFGKPPRLPDEPLTQYDMDLAASVQKVTEEVVVRVAEHAKELFPSDNLCLAGGVALNCVANSAIRERGIFKNIWVQPAAGDAGGALGAAFYTWYQHLGNERRVTGEDSQKGSLLGPAFSGNDIRAYLESRRAPYKMFGDKELLDVVADLIANGNVVGWFNDRMEFGPRALGARSILGDPRNEKMQSVMNLKIKFRESFRPFAPSVLEERAADFFERGIKSSYMLFTFPVARHLRKDMSDENLFGIDRLNVVRSEIPAVTHVDFSARIQTVNEKTNGRYYRLIRRFYEKTGCPVLINTSFNVRGEPIVATPEDAHRCFMRTEMDYLVLGNFLLDKKEQPYDPTVLEETFEDD